MRLLKICSVIFLFSCAFIFCTTADKTDPNVKHYIHVGHTRMFDTISQKVDPRIENINYDTFDMVLLGGDLCEETSKRYDILEYVNEVFDVSNETTLWALGNHDNARLDLVEQITKRRHFYTYHNDGITYVVLYTQEGEDWICTITGEQFDMLKAVTDTISKSSHLIVMTHKLIWIKDNPELAQHQGTGNYDWSCNYSIAPNGWNNEIIPMLRKVMDRGIQVIALAGDIGNNVSTFEERTEDGIYYLASGCNPNNKDAKFLHFKYNVKSRDLTWKFEHLNSFLKYGQKLN